MYRISGLRTHELVNIPVANYEPISARRAVLDQESGIAQRCLEVLPVYFKLKGIRNKTDLLSGKLIKIIMKMLIGFLILLIEIEERLLAMPQVVS